MAAPDRRHRGDYRSSHSLHLANLWRGFSLPAESLNRYVEFSNDLRLFAVRLAIDVDITSIKKFMALADGVRTNFSISGYDWHAQMWCGFGDTSSGYDWRDIRDSSDLAKAPMFVLAKGILKERRSRLSDIGLPEDLIHVLTN